MTGYPILSRLAALFNRQPPPTPPLSNPPTPQPIPLGPRPNLHILWKEPARLPLPIAQSPMVQKYLQLLGPLDWEHFPERDLERNWGRPTIPLTAFTAACLIKLHENRDTMSDLRRLLTEIPELIWLLGFPLVPTDKHPLGFDPEASLPTARHLGYMLREMPNAVAQFLLAESVTLIRDELARQGLRIGECISLDTKHILAWVKENNPKAYVKERFDKTKQPAGDPDCKLGCKRRHNQRSAKEVALAKTPTANPHPASNLQVGEYYWGYGSGVVVTKVPEWGEIVLAEMTQTFDQSDISYFYPLMAQTEARLGFRPRYGTFDAAFDAWYVYAHFYRENDPQAFAAVPLVEKGKVKSECRKFSADGLPLCRAGLPMPLKLIYHDRTRNLFEHERAKYVCPLHFPQKTDQPCPVQHKKMAAGGCTTTMAFSVGARLRYTLDRESPQYKEIYNQRTAVERINSQAKALGIERPYLRCQRSITNLNTFIYTLINLRLFKRIRLREKENESC